MSFELYISPIIVQMLTSRAQTGLQIETQWAVAITAGLLLVGAFIGLMIGWLVTGRDLQHTRNETDQLRLARDNAQSARAQAMNERERAMRELHGKQQEFALLESQLRSTQKQLDQAQAALRISEQQAEELAASARSLRTQVDELRRRLAESEQVSSERQMMLAQATSELTETQARYNETQRLSAERQATLGSVNAQLSEYRARIAEADISTAEMQATLLSLGSQLEAHRMRLAEIERRAQTPREALVPSAAMARPAPQPAVTQVPTAAQASVAAPKPAPPAAAEPSRTSSNGYLPPGTPFEGDDFDEEPNVDRMEAFQDELDNLFQQLQALRAGTSGASSRKPVTNSARQGDAPAAPADTGYETEPLSAPGDSLALESVKGIGTAYASRLRAAGIASVRDLANTTPGHLETIIKAPKWHQPPYASWIRYARLIVRNS